MAVLTLSVRVPGRPEPLGPDWDVPWSPEGGGDEPLTLRDLITRIVREEVAAYRLRQGRQRLIRVLTPDRMEEGIAQGRVLSGGRDPAPAVDEEGAVATALQAFEDGLYLVLLDGKELRRLDETVRVEPGSKLTFIRLTFLAGA